MTKRFCDLCGKPAVDNPDAVYTARDQPLCDPSARVEVRLTVRFVNHSAGFGGPPDLCNEHRAQLADELRKSMTPPESTPPGGKK